MLDQNGTAAKMAPADGLAAAAHLRSHPDPAVRAEAALTLDQSRDPAHLGALLIALNDPDWLVRSNAGWALVHLGAAARPTVEVFARSCVNEEAREMALLVLAAEVREDWPRLVGAGRREDFTRLIGTGRR